MLLTIYPFYRYNTLEKKLEREVTSMNYPFSKKSSLSRFVSLTLVMLLMLTMLGGCSLLPTKTPATEPSTEPSESAPQLNLVEETETTAPPTTETTAPPTTEAKKENVAVVKEQLNIRSSPSTGSRVITQLDAGDEVEVLRIEPIGTVQWAYVSSDTLNVMGWIVTDMLDMTNVQLASGSTSTPANTVPTTAGGDPTQSTAPVNGITGTGAGNTPANSQTGTVNTNTLNIRASASTNSERVGAYTFGDRITILETKDGWGRTDKGWVSMNYVTIGNNAPANNTPSSSTPTGTGSGNAVVSGSGVNIRTGAGTDYPIITTVGRGESLTILETTTEGGRQWGRTAKGWICMDYVTVTGTIGSAGGNGTVTGNGLNIRAGAGTDFAIVGSLSQGATVSVLETTTIGASRWGRINEGWICLDYVRMN